MNLDTLNMFMATCISFLVTSPFVCSLPISIEVFHFFSLICKTPYLYDINVLSIIYVVKLEVGRLQTSFSASPGKIKWES